MISDLKKFKWSQNKLGDESLSFIVMGQSPSSEFYHQSPVGLPFFQGKADFGFVHPVAQSWCSNPVKIAEKNDILISVRAPVGANNISNEKCCIGRGLAAIRIKLPHSYLFFKYVLDFKQTEIESLGTGTTFKSINKTTLYDFVVPVPTINEQLRIAAILHKIQKAIEVENQLLQTTRELKKSTMKQLFTHGLRGEKLKETEIGLVPESWEVIALSEKCTIQPGYAFKSQDYKKEGARLFRISNVSFGMTDWSDTAYLPEEYLQKHSEYKLNHGDLVMAMTRPIVQGGIKVTLLNSSDCPALLNQRVCRFVAHHGLELSFLFQILFNPIFVASISQDAIGSQQPNISASKIGLIKIPVPKIDEQKQIARILQTIDQKIEIHEKKKNTLQDLFKTMLHKLMTAEIRVHDLDIDTSEVV
jgi:type I restriction enzyme S subunit